MIIDFSSLEKQKNINYKYSEYFDRHTNPFLDTGLDFADELYIEYNVKRIEDEYSVSGKYKTSINLDCDKCGEKYKNKLYGKFNFFIMQEKPDEKGSDEDPDVLIIPPSKKIDLTDSIREHLLILLPVTNKCREDCAGLCPVCGKNLNIEKCECSADEINPAFEKLSQLLKN